MNSDLILSSEIACLVADLDGGKNIRDRLIACADLARLQEAELAVHRLGEAGKKARSSMEQEAGKVLNACILDTNGKVVRPDFNKGRK